MLDFPAEVIRRIGEQLVDTVPTCETPIQSSCQGCITCVKKKSRALVPLVLTCHFVYDAVRPLFRASIGFVDRWGWQEVACLLAVVESDPALAHEVRAIYSHAQAPKWGPRALENSKKYQYELRRAYDLVHLIRACPELECLFVRSSLALPDSVGLSKGAFTRLTCFVVHRAPGAKRFKPQALIDVVRYMPHLKRLHLQGVPRDETFRPPTIARLFTLENIKLAEDFDEPNLVPIDPVLLTWLTAPTTPDGPVPTLTLVATHVYSTAGRRSQWSLWEACLSAVDEHLEHLEIHGDPETTGVLGPILDPDELAAQTIDDDPLPEEDDVQPEPDIDPLLDVVYEPTEPASVSSFDSWFGDDMVAWVRLHRPNHDSKNPRRTTGGPVYFQRPFTAEKVGVLDAEAAAQRTWQIRLPGLFGDNLFPQLKTIAVFSTESYDDQSQPTSRIPYTWGPFELEVAGLDPVSVTLTRDMEGFPSKSAIRKALPKYAAIAFLDPWGM